MIREKVLFLVCLVFFSVSVTMQLSVKASPGLIRVPGDYITIQEAINHASPGDTVQVSAGTYRETLFINQTLTLLGEDKTKTIIIGSGSGVTVIKAYLTTVNISGFTIKCEGDGITLEKCNSSIVKGNDVNATRRGIWLYESDYNTVSDNIVSNSIWRYGIILCGHSSNNTIVRNMIKDNVVGLGMTGEDNLIFDNDFIDNQNQTEIVESYPNAWNNTYEGNYWSNYNGTDADQDGIGDTPYPIDESNTDNHPLMGMFSQFNIIWREKTYTVTTICNSTITSIDFKTTQENAIRFNIEGPEGTRGFCRTVIPKTLLDVNHTILVEGLSPLMEKELPPSNSTHAYLYFKYVLPIPQMFTIPKIPVGVILASITIIISLGTIYLARKAKLKEKQK
jgi:parallel beta-helix repeat protein